MDAAAADQLVRAEARSYCRSVRRGWTKGGGVCNDRAWMSRYDSYRGQSMPLRGARLWWNRCHNNRSARKMENVETALPNPQSEPAATIDPIVDVAADLELQEQLIRDITSDDLQVLRKVGFKTVLKPHQKVFRANSC